MSTSSTIIQWIKDMHEPNWGYIIYRCTYGDDQAWARCLARIRQHMERSLKEDEYGAQALQKLDLVIRENHLLQGATSRQIRIHFNALCKEWEKDEGFGTRYEICLMIDQASMDSILAPSDEEDKEINPAHTSPAFLTAVDRKDIIPRQFMMMMTTSILGR
ncbi:MAG: hypothetical protein Q9168_004827 [Polycauliona sp. 1 TL-2023]